MLRPGRCVTARVESVANDMPLNGLKHSLVRIIGRKRANTIAVPYYGWRAAASRLERIGAASFCARDQCARFEGLSITI